MIDMFIHPWTVMLVVNQTSSLSGLPNKAKFPSLSSLVKNRLSFDRKFGSGVVQEFLVLPGDADIDAFLDGSTDEPGRSCNKMQPASSLG